MWIPTTQENVVGGGSNSPGYEIGYAERTTNVTISGTTEAAPTDLGLSLGAITYDGTPIMLEFFISDLEIGAGAIILLFDNTTMLCRVADYRTASANGNIPVGMAMRFTPSAASHTYNLQGVRVGGTNATLYAGTGTGGAGLYAPAFIRATKV